MPSATPTAPTYIPPLTDLSLKLVRDAFPPINSLPPLPPFALRIPVTVTASRRARLPIQYSLFLPPVIRKPLEYLSVIHAELINEENVIAHLKVVRGTPCPRWHVDKVPLRGLCTLHGPGSVIMADDDREIELGAGDMVFVPGSGYDDSGEGVLHRSPVVHETRMRILLQTDCVKRR